MKKYVIANRTQFFTAGELRQLLSKLNDDTPVYITGSDGWFHAPDDLSYVCLDCTDLDDCYEDYDEDF